MFPLSGLDHQMVEAYSQPDAERFLGLDVDCSELNAMAAPMRFERRVPTLINVKFNTNMC
jgi:hypothetical protein